MNKLGRFFDYALKNHDNFDCVVKKAEKINLNKLLLKCRQKKNYLGEGAYSETYRVNKNYVLQFYKNYFPENIDINKIFFNKKSPLNSLKLWNGSVLLKIEQIKLLKNANPTKKAIEVGVPYKITNVAKIKEHYEKIYLPKCAKLPQSEFDKLANDFNLMNQLSSSQLPPSHSYIFDAVNPNNILITKRSIRTIDDIEITKGKNLNNLSMMVNALLNKYNLGITITEFSPKLAPIRMKILKKCIIANEKAQLSLDSINKGNMNLAFMLADQKGKWPLVNEQIVFLRESCPNLSTRIKKISKFLDNLDKIKLPEEVPTYNFV